MAGLVFIALVLAAIAWIVLRSKRRADWRSPEHQLERMLGPRAAERLIHFEQERQPGLSRARAAQRALERAEYDRSR